MTLKTVGRAFWIGLAVSLALHAFFIAKGRFQMPRLADTPVLEARLEAEEFKAAPPPVEVHARPAAPKQPEPQSAAAPTGPLPAAPLPQAAPAFEEPAPPPAKAEAVLPLSAAEPPPASAQPYAALTEAAQNLRELPAHIEIVFELNGFLNGRQTHVWQRSGQRYTLDTEAEVTGLASLFMGGKMIQKSRGRISALGLMPEQYEMQRMSGKKESMRFDYEANVIESTRTDAKRGTRTLELPLLTGAQDPLSSIYQLAMSARTDNSGFIVAAGAKRVKGYPYRTLGMETLRTGFGEMKALHVARTGDTEKSSTHLWLAPDQHFLPVRVSFVEDDGTEWVLEAVSISTR
jgi:hypothetical protein